MDGRENMTRPKGLRAGFILLAFMTAFFTPAFGVTFNSNGNPGDTPGGTVITADPTLETMGCKDLNGTTMTATTPVTAINNTVTSEYGLSGPGTPVDVNVNPGDVVYHYYAVTNEGNANDSYTLKHSFFNYGGATGWVVEVWEGASRIVTLDAGSVAQESRTVNDNSDKYFYYKVIVSSESSGAPNSAYIKIVTTVETTSIPTGKYAGGNSLYYGGLSNVSDDVVDSVAAPVLTISRVSTVDAPTAYAGSIHDAVPGSVLTFTITYGNTGGASAESVILVDRVPANTNLAHINTNGAGTNVSITAAQGNAVGWVVKYSKLDNPNKTYGNTADWSGGNGGTIGTLTSGTEQFPGGSATYQTGNDAYGAKWIKWEKLYVDKDEDNRSLTWGVTIR
jgi:uncharacterized repeat protein (TIGR01451 family)